jgi:hypothetical protein
MPPGDETPKYRQGSEPKPQGQPRRRILVMSVLSLVIIAVVVIVVARAYQRRRQAEARDALATAAALQLNQNNLQAATATLAACPTMTTPVIVVRDTGSLGGLQVPFWQEGGSAEPWLWRFEIVYDDAPVGSGVVWPPIVAMDLGNADSDDDVRRTPVIPLHPVEVVAGHRLQLRLFVDHPDQAVPPDLFQTHPWRVRAAGATCTELGYVLAVQQGVVPL